MFFIRLFIYNRIIPCKQKLPILNGWACVWYSALLLYMTLMNPSRAQHKFTRIFSAAPRARLPFEIRSTIYFWNTRPHRTRICVPPVDFSFQNFSIHIKYGIYMLDSKSIYIKMYMYT